MTQTTLAFTTAKGSDGLNVLPQEAYVTGNMRLIHHQSGGESIAAVGKIAAKYGIETEVLYQDPPCPVVGFQSKQFGLIEDITAEIYPGVQVTPYVMTGGTDAKFYKDICPNCIRFAPLYIDEQQYGSVHGLNENIHQGTLPHGVDFYKKVIEKMASIINSHIRGRNVSDIYLVGGTCCLKDMEKIIAKETGKPVCKPSNPFLVTPLGIALNCVKKD
jgi:carboxypeptidase PM20D1